jgi:hypothetical protein
MNVALTIKYFCYPVVYQNCRGFPALLPNLFHSLPPFRLSAKTFKEDQSVNPDSGELSLFNNLMLQKCNTAKGYAKT